MPNPFLTAQNSTTPVVAALCGETFLLGTTEWPAVSVEMLTAREAAQLGGRYTYHTTTLYIDQETLTASGLKQGDVVTVRGSKVRVDNIERDGGDVILLNCAPVGAKLKSF